MAVGYPLKTTYADGDVYSASDVNDTNGTINLMVGNSVGTNTQIAGKNKIINGDFRINQRGFTSNTANASYNFDRFIQYLGGSSGTLTVTPQTFTAGTAPVTGYEAINYVQCVTASGASVDTYAQYGQLIEDVRTFAGQTVTVSFWAKASSGTPSVAVELQQNFGAGGSPSATVTGILASTPKQAITTSWARYSFTISVPSISGKTIGTTLNSSYLYVALWLSAGSNYNSRTGTLGLQNNTFQFWGLQIENGSVATPFQTASGSIPGELALCQRYYEKSYEQGTTPGTGTVTGMYFFPYAVNVFSTLNFTMEKRTAPSVSIWDSAGNANKATTGDAAAALTANRTETIPTYSISSKSIMFRISDGVAGSVTLGYHWTASAELT